MAGERSPLRRQHTEPYFWQYACSYILIGSGLLIWLGELIAGTWPGNSGVGLVGMWMGLWLLATIRNRRLKERIDELEKQIQGTSADRESDG